MDSRSPECVVTVTRAHGHSAVDATLSYAARSDVWSGQARANICAQPSARAARASARACEARHLVLSLRRAPGQRAYLLPVSEAGTRRSM